MQLSKSKTYFCLPVGFSCRDKRQKEGLQGPGVSSKHMGQRPWWEVGSSGVELGVQEASPRSALHTQHMRLG